jgi:phage protein D
MPEAALSTNALYSARPTLRLNGREQERLTGLLLALEMNEQEDGLSTLELKLSNWANNASGGADFAFEDEAVLKLGDRLAIYTGEEAAPQEIFSGTASALEAEFREDGAPTLTVLAEDKLQLARFRRRTKAHTAATVAGIAQAIASDLGLTPQISGLSQSCGTQLQCNESDLAFLRRLLARYDGDVQIAGTELHAAPRGQIRRGAVTLERGSQLRRVTVLADLAHQVNEVTVTGWDAKAGSRITSRSSGANQGPGSGRTGASLLQNALARREHHLGHLAVLDSSEGTALADAAYDERQRRFVTATGTAEGNPAIRVGTHLTLAGLSPRFNNTYYVVRCCHRFDQQRGYETDFTAESAFLGNP